MEPIPPTKKKRPGKTAYTITVRQVGTPADALERERELARFLRNVLDASNRGKLAA